MPCSRNDNVCGDDYDFAARDDHHVGCDDHRRGVDHHFRSIDLYTSRYHHYTGGDDNDTSGDHHNATSHHHLDPRSVILAAQHLTAVILSVVFCFCCIIDVVERFDSTWVHGWPST